ncbi:DUF1062 domain-containing protein [Actinoplanes aureus]|uniref:DUF1062 domain-containing protein n=1 Tax=Actinoplanes aureus TaxID=2792083 RepID=UPI002815C191|nr:DUF1062 domain-containing protein [Actinoplanes aureus]
MAADLLRPVRPHVEIPVHERINVRALDNERLLRFENNDPAMVRQVTMDATLAHKAAYQLDWTGTWQLDTDIPFYDLQREDAARLEVIIRFELPAPIRVEKLLTAGFDLSRPAVRGMVDSGRIRLPLPIDAKAREDFTFLVPSPPHRCHPSGHEVPLHGAMPCAVTRPERWTSSRRTARTSSNYSTHDGPSSVRGGGSPAH